MLAEGGRLHPPRGHIRPQLAIGPGCWVSLCWTQPSFTLTVSLPGLAPPQLTACRHQNLLSSYLPMVDPARAPRSFCLWASWTSAAPLPSPDNVSPSLCVFFLVSLYLCLLCLHLSLSPPFFCIFLYFSTSISFFIHLSIYVITQHILNTYYLPGTS